MGLQRIRASTAATAPETTSALSAEAIHLTTGGILRDRSVTRESALIVARGLISVTTEDEKVPLVLTVSDGVLLPTGTVYSLQAKEESLALLFERSTPGS